MRRGRPCGRRASRIPQEQPLEASEVGSVNEPQPDFEYKSQVSAREETLMETIAQLLAKMPQPLPPPTPSTADYILRAKKLGIEKFDGNCDPDTAIHWLDSVEEIFALMGCSDDQKVSITVFQLKDRAFYWWEAILRRATVGIVWDKFKRQFYDYFCPEAEVEMPQLRLMPQPQPQPPRPPPVSAVDYILRAKKLGAETFDGNCDPDIAILWLESVERIFEVMGCSDDRKVSIAVFLLKNRASYWWETVLKRATMGIVWDEFKRQFYDYFYPKVYRDAKVNEFCKLQQGSMIVKEYERQFMELARAAPFIVNNEEFECTMFRNGLRQEIRVYVSTHCLYVPLVKEALRVERDLGGDHQAQRGKQKRFEYDGSAGGSSSKTPRTSCSSGQSSEGSVRSPMFQRGSRSGRVSVPQCQRCGRSHRGECIRGPVRCYHCGNEGHYKWDCPELAIAQSKDPRSTSRRSSGNRHPQLQVREPPSSNLAKGAFSRGNRSRGHAGRSRS